MIIPLLAAAATLMAPSAKAAPAPTAKHIFTIVLENKDYEKTFGPDTEAPYLAETLRSKGALLTNYYGTGHFSLDNYITMVSGQAPNPQTQADCIFFTDFLPPVVADGQAVGNGCVYPSSVKTVADQLEEKGLTWKGYMQDMGADPEREAATCAHPPVGARDPTQSAAEKDQYATRHNPFMYFHSIIDDQARCDASVVNLEKLTADLKSAASTPNFAFITPDLCADGHDSECIDPKQKGGYEGIDDFLEQWVPRILAAPAFKRDGLLIVTFDEAEDDSTACCDEPTGPNTPRPGVQGPGGGRTGTVLIGPTIKPGATSETEINHYGYLRSIEDFFGLEHLGYAAQDGLATFQTMGVGRAADLPPTPVAPDVKRFTVRRRGERLIIRVRLAAGLGGKLTIRKGKVLRRYTLSGKATYRIKAPRGSKVVLRAMRNGRTVRTLTKRG